MKHEEHDELWDLLGKTRQPKPSAFFAANVMRAIRAESEPKPGLLAWLRMKWVLPVAAGTCAAVLALIASQPSVSTTPADSIAADPLEGIALAAAAAPETAPSFDSLFASEDHSIWLAGDPSSLY